MTQASERARVESILRAMTREQCKSYPDRNLIDCWHYIDEAMQIMRDTHVLSYQARMDIVQNEHRKCHAED
jgi:hypothetical protein